MTLENYRFFDSKNNKTIPVSDTIDLNNLEHKRTVTQQLLFKINNEDSVTGACYVDGFHAVQPSMINSSEYQRYSQFDGSSNVFIPNFNFAGKYCYPLFTSPKYSLSGNTDSQVDLTVYYKGTNGDISQQGTLRIKRGDAEEIISVPHNIIMTVQGSGGSGGSGGSNFFLVLRDVGSGGGAGGFVCVQIAFPYKLDKEIEFMHIRLGKPGASAWGYMSKTWGGVESNSGNSGQTTSINVYPSDLNIDGLDEIMAHGGGGGRKSDMNASSVSGGEGGNGYISDNIKKGSHISVHTLQSSPGSYVYNFIDNTFGGIQGGSGGANNGWHNGRKCNPESIQVTPSTASEQGSTINSFAGGQNGASKSIEATNYSRSGGGGASMISKGGDGEYFTKNSSGWEVCSSSIKVIQPGPGAGSGGGCSGDSYESTCRSAPGGVSKIDFYW